MSTLQDSFLAATSPQLLSRFTAAVWRSATVIVNEDPATQNHAARVTWAGKALLTNGAAQSYAFTILRLAFSENATLQAQWATDTSAGTGVLDADVLTSVSAYVIKFIAAGV
jgi:hypothetical protein